jgi:hypothetical protein
MESAIPEHLRKEKTCPFRHPEGYTPSYPTRVARYPLNILRVVKAYIGIQYRPETPATNLTRPRVLLRPLRRYRNSPLPICLIAMSADLANLNMQTTRSDFFFSCSGSRLSNEPWKQQEERSPLPMSGAPSTSLQYRRPHRREMFASLLYQESFWFQLHLSHLLAISLEQRTF